MKPNRRLKEAREQRGWSQARVAEQIGTDAGNVSRWERGYSSPSPYYREKLSSLFGKEVCELGLLGEDGEAPSSQSGPDPALVATQREAETLTLISRIMAGLSYSLFWWTGLIILLFFKKDRFVHFHSLQSLLLFGSVTLCNAAFIGIVSSLNAAPISSSHSVPITGPLDFIIVLVVLCILVLDIGAVVAWIVGIVMALKGRYYKLPLVGDPCEKIANV